MAMVWQYPMFWRLRFDMELLSFFLWWCLAQTGHQAISIYHDSYRATVLQGAYHLTHIMTCAPMKQCSRGVQRSTICTSSDSLRCYLSLEVASSIPAWSTIHGNLSNMFTLVKGDMASSYWISPWWGSRFEAGTYTIFVEYSSKGN